MFLGGAVATVGVFIPIIHFGHGGSCYCLRWFHWHRNSTWVYMEKGIQLLDNVKQWSGVVSEGRSMETVVEQEGVVSSSLRELKLS